MTSRQRGIVITASIVALGALFAAPFRYVGHSSITDPVPTSGHLYRPIFAPPSGIVSTAKGIVFLDKVELDAGRLGIIWVAIAIVAVLGVAISGAGREPQGVVPRTSE